MEEWKVAVEDYEISNFGNCRRRMKNGQYRIIKGSLMSTPASKNKVYQMRYFQIQRNGKRINYLFSHLVAKCFIGERPEGFEVDHIDINPLNNNVLNLRYVTHRDNCLNQKRTVDIPLDAPNRTQLVRLKYIAENKETILQNKKEYYLKHKEIILEKQKRYTDDNKDRIKDYNKQWREDNKDELKEKNKKYVEEHQEEIKARKNEKVSCECCGKNYSRSHKSDHLKSKYHLNNKK